MTVFAGWRMPVLYDGILPEHRAVRTGVGMFDISHMGQVIVEGEAAGNWLNRLLTNNAVKLAPETGQYTLLLNERGGVIDDLILYRLDVSSFMLVVNAAKAVEDMTWLRDRLEEGVTISDRGHQFGGIAVQGPLSAELACSLFGDSNWLPPRNGVRIDSNDSVQAYVCRTGYTGEDGFELFAPCAVMSGWWQRLLDLGAKPCGLGARDTLRLEMGYPLNGADLTPDHTPLEAGLAFFVDLNKDFVGRDALRRQRQTGLPAKLTGLECVTKGPPLRAGYTVYHDDVAAGQLTSGCLSPSLGYGIGMAYLPPPLSKPGSAFEVEIRHRRYPLVAVKKPFYRP